MYRHFSLDRCNADGRKGERRHSVKEELKEEGEKVIA